MQVVEDTSDQNKTDTEKASSDEIESVKGKMYMHAMQRLHKLLEKTDHGHSTE